MSGGVTTHGFQRARQRLGIPRRAVARMAAKALRDGIPRENWAGEMRRYLDGKFHNTDNAGDLRVHGDFVYIFGCMGTFVTCWRLPEYLKLRRT